MANATVTLHAPSLTEGFAGEACLFHIGELDFKGDPLSTPLPLMASASNGNTNVATAVVSGLDVDVRAAGAGTTTVTITDGRVGVTPAMVDVTVLAAPPGSVVILSQGPVRTR
jgi:hypothetical protein